MPEMTKKAFGHLTRMTYLPPTAQQSLVSLKRDSSNSTDRQSTFSEMHFLQTL